MTQQNETRQGAAEAGPPEQLASASPDPDGSDQDGLRRQARTSPHSGMPEPIAPPRLFGYEALPEAYLAPPQPGQPRYGTPSYPGGGRPFAGRPGYGEPGNGQPGQGQRGYGTPAPSRPGPGAAAARRDPALAPPWQRLVALTIDWAIIFVVSVIVFWPQLSVVWRELQAVSGRYPNVSPAAQAAVDSIFRSQANQHAMLYWFLGMFGLALVYYWVQHAAWGATVGKRAFGIRVVRAADRSRLGVLVAGIRTVAFLVGPAIFLLLIWPINVMGGVLWAADAGLPLLNPRAQSLHDKVAGTIVVRQVALDEAARRSGGW